MITALANVVLVLVYGSIALIMLHGLVRGRQWASNPIATATFAIFAACTVGHGLHLEDTLLPYTGVLLGYTDTAQAAAVTEAARATFSDPLLLVWDVFTAMVAAWYWTIRSRFALLFHGAALCEDMATRTKQAMELHDNVVQGLTRAKLALDLGRREEGAAVVDETLAASKHIIADILGREATIGLGPGDLRRETPGGGGR